MQGRLFLNKGNGFSLIETMCALAILSLGLLAVGPLMCVALKSDSLARSKSTAAIAAQNKIESLADLYQRNPSSEDLMLGNHGPSQTQVVNPGDGTILNRYGINWAISEIPDPRPDKKLDARLIRITVAPITQKGEENTQPALNKTLNVSTIISPMTQRRTL